MRGALSRAAAIGLAVLLTAAAMSLPAAAPADAASPPDTTDTGDPPPPADPTVPDGVQDPPNIPDETIVEMPPPASPDIVANANSLPIAWVGRPDQRPAPGALLTLQAAINAAPAGATVSFVPNDYAFTGALLIQRSVLLDSATASVLYTRFTVSGGGLALADDVVIGAANTGAVVTVTASGAVLSDLTIRNPTPVLRPTGVQLGATVTGVVIDGLDMDGGGQASSYGVNLTTGSATITDPTIGGVATGVIATAASRASGISVSGGTVAGVTSGIALGGAVGPRVTEVEVSGPPGAGTGVDLSASSGAVVDGVTVQGFARGIATLTTNDAAGPTILDAVVVGTTKEGIALGVTTGATIRTPTITMAGATQSTGILTFYATGVQIEQPTISGVMYGITTHVGNTGAGPVITSPTITAFSGITLGSTQRARVTGAVLDSGSASGGTGINTVNAGRVTISDETATGFLYAIASQSTVDLAADRVDISISDITVVGPRDASHGVYLLGVRNATVSRVTADLTGTGLVVHLSDGVTAQDIVVTGHEGATPVSGAAILRAYGSSHVNVDRASIDAGSYGFFYSGVTGSTVTNATVENLVEYGLYGRSVSNLDVSATTFRRNSAVGMFVVTKPADGISHDIVVHDNVMTDNDAGISVLQGTTAVQILRNRASGQATFVVAGPAHDLLVADNTVTQGGTDETAAITVAPLWEDGALPGSYSSSGVQVTGNVFAGGGTWLRVGTADAGSDEAARRTLRDAVRVTGNTFPEDSVAVHTYPNAVVGHDTASAAQRALPVDGPVAVDARDYDDPNDWGSPCRATGYLDGDPYYDGGGAEVLELTEAPVLYPMSCIDLSLDERLASDLVVRPGDLLTWTLDPHNDGPRAAPAGWTVTQVLPDGVELVSMAGDGYTVDGATVTAAAELPAGADAAPVTVTARVVAAPPGQSTMRDVAYVAPAPETDLDDDGFVDSILEPDDPLLVPDITTDTTTTPTNNDTQGVWTVVGAPAPSPPSGDGPSPAPAPAPSPSPSPSSVIAVTGAEGVRLSALAAALVAGGLGLWLLRRREARRSR